MHQLSRLLGINTHRRWPKIFSPRFLLIATLCLVLVLYQRRSRTDSTPATTDLDSRYAKVLVVSSQKREYTGWVNSISGIEPVVYVTDDPDAALKPPRNKGRESMVYLTYIIDNYDDLPDIAVFVHGDDRSWHNEETMEGKTSVMLSRLNWEYIVKHGYFNLRCSLNPGCPHWLDLSGTRETSEINAEETEAARRAWNELHPGHVMPDSLSQPCCSQFAASRDRIRSVLLSRWKHYQQWLLTTDLHDGIAGRVWEYTWQYVLTGRSELCPDGRGCLCQGYKICFGSVARYQDWLRLQAEREELFSEYLGIRSRGDDDPKLAALLKQAESKERAVLEEAKIRGLDPYQRAREL